MSQEILDLINELLEKGRENGISFFIALITESDASWSASVSNGSRKKASEIISNLINILQEKP